jgi:hypothetical protein
MAVGYRTLSELAQGSGSPDITNIVDEITKSTSMLPDASFVEANSMLENKGFRKTSLPTNEWVAVDEGGTESKGYKEMFSDNLGIIESWQSSRQKESMLSANPTQLESEDQMDHVTSMGLDVESCLIYGGDDPKEFKGIMPRFNKITTDFITPSFMTLDNAGNTDGAMSSVLFVVWGRGGANMLTPRYHATSGIQVTKGDWQVISENGKNFFEKKTQFMMMTGLSVMNRFSIIRIANISTADSDITTQMAKLRTNMYKAFTLLPKDFKNRVRIYAPGSVLYTLNAYNSSLVNPITYSGAVPQNAIGYIMFDRFVVRQCESMLPTEDVVA